MTPHIFAVAALILACLIAHPAAAGPPDASPSARISDLRAKLDNLRAHPFAKTVRFDLDEMRHQLRQAHEQWTRGDKVALRRTLTLVDAHIPLIRARLAVARTRSALAEVDRELTNAEHTLEARQTYRDTLRAQVEGGAR